MDIVHSIKQSKFLRGLWEAQRSFRIFPFYVSLKLHGHPISFKCLKQSFYVGNGWRRAYSAGYFNEKICKGRVIYTSDGIAANKKQAISFFEAFLKRSDFENYTHVVVVKSRSAQKKLWKKYKARKNITVVLHKSSAYGHLLSGAEYIVCCGSLSTAFSKRSGQHVLYFGKGCPEQIVEDSAVQPRTRIRSFLLADLSVAVDPYISDIYKKFRLCELCSGSYLDNTDKHLKKADILKLFLEDGRKQAGNSAANSDTVLPKRLYILGSLLKNTLSKKAMKALAAEDTEKCDITLFLAKGTVSDESFQLKDIPKGVRVIVGTKLPPITPLEAKLRRDIFAVLTEKHSEKDCRDYCRREYLRNFGNTEFDEVIDYTGYSKMFEGVINFGAENTPKYEKIPVVYQNGRPKISIIVPVYNVEKYLKKCLKTLGEQSIDELEALVVNDGTPDASQDIINSFALLYPDRILPLIKKNGGLSDARNYAMPKARGEYITFVDSDDYVKPDAMLQYYKTAVENGADLVISDFTKIIERTRKERIRTGKKFLRRRQYVTSHTKRDGVSAFENPKLLRYAFSYVSNKCFKRELIIDGGFQFPVGQWFEDSAVVYNIIMSAKKISYLRESTYCYRVGREGAITSTLDKRMFDIFKSCDSILNFSKEHGYYELLQPEIEYLCIMHIHARLIALQSTYNIKLIKSFVKKSYAYLEESFPSWVQNKYYCKVRNDRILKDTYYGYNKYRHAEKTMYKYLLRNSLKLVIFHNKFISAVLDLSDRVKNRLKRMFFPAPDNAAVPVVDPKLLEEQKILEQQKKDREVKAIQQYSLRIMDIIHKFCEENDIQYFLAEGSLLGAVRHGGFIPWDDDMDICMLRPDYDRFIKLWGKREIEQCVMFNRTTYKKYYLPFTKIILTEETGFRNNKKYFPEKYQGPFVDIFPIDKCTGEITQEDIYKLGDLRRYRDYLLYKIGYIKNHTKRKRLRRGANSTTYKTLHRKIDEIARGYHNNTDGYVANFFSSYTIFNEHFKADWFKNAELVDFDGRKYYIPSGAKEILTVIYGDYMTPPPENKQVCKHGFTVLDDIRAKLSKL